MTINAITDLPKAQVLGLSGGGGNVVWPPPPREPLPPFPLATSAQPAAPQASCWSSAGDYLSAMPVKPSYPDLRWHRGNFSGVRVPNFTEGEVAEDRSLIMTWDGPRWSLAGQQQALDWYANGCGYTHWVLSLPQTMLNHGLPFEAVRDFARLAKSYGQYVIVNILGGDAPWRDEWTARSGYVQTLIDANLLDIGCLCWQIDKWYPPMDVVEATIEIGAWLHARGRLMTCHWGGGYAGWAENCACWDEQTAEAYGIDSRYTFYSVLAPYVDGPYGQCNTEAPMDEVQSWIRKVVDALPEPLFFVASEMDAQAQFDDPQHRLELYGDLKGYLATCVSPAGRVSALNGIRLPDGSIG